jgi:hypothetical protein
MKKNNHNRVESLDSFDSDEDGFLEGSYKVGKAIASFNFGKVQEEQSSKSTVLSSPTTNKPQANQAPSNFRFRSSQKSVTPAVDGEPYTIKRCYQFRPSTIRKLNELKASHSDFNVYLNTVIDEAISYYYDHVFLNKSN